METKRTTLKQTKKQNKKIIPLAEQPKKAKKG